LPIWNNDLPVNGTFHPRELMVCCQLTGTFPRYSLERQAVFRTPLLWIAA
jgi:hypothetical protein